AVWRLGARCVARDPRRRRGDPRRLCVAKIAAAAPAQPGFTDLARARPPRRDPAGDVHGTAVAAPRPGGGAAAVYRRGPRQPRGGADDRCRRLRAVGGMVDRDAVPGAVPDPGDGAGGWSATSKTGSAHAGNRARLDLVGDPHLARAGERVLVFAEIFLRQRI